MCYLGDFGQISKAEIRWSQKLEEQESWAHEHTGDPEQVSS
jgi:hypothetical protein